MNLQIPISRCLLGFTYTHFLGGPFSWTKSGVEGLKIGVFTDVIVVKRIDGLVLARPRSDLGRHPRRLKVQFGAPGGRRRTTVDSRIRKVSIVFLSGMGVNVKWIDFFFALHLLRSMLTRYLPSANLSLIKFIFFLPRRKAMQWFSFISGMTAGTFAGTVMSALCHVAARSDGVDKREKSSKVNACVIRSDCK